MIDFSLQSVKRTVLIYEHFGRVRLFIQSERKIPSSSAGSKTFGSVKVTVNEQYLCLQQVLKWFHKGRWHTWRKSPNISFTWDLFASRPEQHSVCIVARGHLVHSVYRRNISISCALGVAFLPKGVKILEAPCFHIPRISFPPPLKKFLILIYVKHFSSAYEPAQINIGLWRFGNSLIYGIVLYVAHRSMLMFWKVSFFDFLSSYRL